MCPPARPPARALQDEFSTVSNVWNAIFLGNFATPLDPFEDNDPFDVDDMENSAALVGETFGSFGDPLSAHVTEITGNDVSGQAGYLDVDNAVSNDSITYDIGSGSQTVVLDAVALYNATITYMDGSTATITATVLQDTSGNLFLAPETSNNADTAALEAAQIKSITFDSEDTDHNFGTPGAETTRYDTLFVCFAAGTLIDTPDGPRAVETLGPGCQVLTCDHGAQPVLWASQKQVDGAGPSAPVRIRKGALGRGLPRRDLWVSQQHRILVRSPIASRIFGRRAVLVAAKHLTGLHRIRVEPVETVRYCTFAVKRHALVRAEGALAESLYLGPEVRHRLNAQERKSLGRVFPATLAGLHLPRPARPFAEGRKAKDLCRRHAKNRRPVFS